MGMSIWLFMMSILLVGMGDDVVGVEDVVMGAKPPYAPGVSGRDAPMSYG